MLEKYKKNKQNDSKKNRVFARWFLFFLVLLLFFGIGFSSWTYIKKNSFFTKENISYNKNKVEKQDLIINENSFVSDDYIVDKNSDDKEVSVSKNYKIKQVRFGGNVVLLDNNDKSPLEIYDVKSEITTSQEDGEPRFLVTWKTNKAAISKVVYSKSNGAKTKSVTEEGYGFEHSALIKNMDFSTIYVYKIKSTDKWGNKADTEYFSVYTGEKSESIFDLIFNAVQDVFGWAMRE